MSRLFALIQTQVDNLFKFNVQSDQGLVLPAWIPHQMYLRPLINIISAVFFILIVLMFGKFLWNQGLAPVFNVISPIGEFDRRPQYSAFMQLIVTLLALMMIL